MAYRTGRRLNRFRSARFKREFRDFARNFKNRKTCFPLTIRRTLSAAASGAQNRASADSQAAISTA